jgi:hypothetical protein
VDYDVRQTASAVAVGVHCPFYDDLWSKGVGFRPSLSLRELRESSVVIGTLLELPTPAASLVLCSAVQLVIRVFLLPVRSWV